MSWIKIEDKKPDRITPVLVAIDRGGLQEAPIKREIHVAYRMTNGDVWIIGGRFGFDMGKVTHWKPIDLLPEGDEFKLR
jgi:hypothetical protein